jgi:hypothetical protein
LKNIQLKYLPPNTTSLLGSIDIGILENMKTIFTPCSESASELYRPSDRRLSAKWLPTLKIKQLTI